MSGRGNKTRKQAAQKKIYLSKSLAKELGVDSLRRLEIRLTTDQKLI
jgi:hypothetical protein